jgi:leucyl aminopeptidase
MKFSLDANPAPGIEAECLVIGVFEDSPLSGSAKLVDQASNGALQQLIKSGDVDPNWKHPTMLHGLEGVTAKRILVMGFGEVEKFNTVRYDHVCQSAGAYLRDHATSSAHICLNEVHVDDKDAHWNLRQAAVRIDRANYRYTATKLPKDHDNDPLVSASFNANEDLGVAIAEARGLAKGYLCSRELGNIPPNICTPEYLAERAREFANNYANVSVEILGVDEMTSLKMAALLIKI